MNPLSKQKKRIYDTKTSINVFNKNIILGVTGGIAAYKSAEIVRHLKKSGSSVRVVMTASAEEFITPLTMQALSGNRVRTTTS